MSPNARPTTTTGEFTTDTFDRQRFSPRDYNSTYFSCVMEDERRLAEWTFSTALPEANKREIETMLDVGCGPTVHHALAFSNSVRSIHLAENLAELGLWLNNDPQAHDAPRKTMRRSRKQRNWTPATR